MTQRTTARLARVDHDAPEHWNGSAALMDLADAKLRKRAQSLVQACGTDAEKALAIYNFVRRLPLRARGKLRLRTAREVLQRGSGDAIDKATLLVALLRIAKLPARLRFGVAPRETLRGLGMDVCSLPWRPFVEVWLGERWQCTDTFIFDSACHAAARQRLRQSREEFGYGIQVADAVLWEAQRDVFLLGYLARDEMLAPDARAWHDPLEFASAQPGRPRLRLLAQLACWSLAAPFLERTLERLRAEGRRQLAQRRARFTAPAALSERAKTRPQPLPLDEPSSVIMA